MPVFSRDPLGRKYAYTRKIVRIAIQDQYKDGDNEAITFHNNVRVAETPVTRDSGSAFIHSSVARETGREGSDSR